jgi:alkaline phosphatase
VTVPLVTSTVTDATPSTAEISWVMARSQCAQGMPFTVKVVEPTKVRGVPNNIGVLLGAGRW